MSIEYPNLEPLFRPRSVAVIGASDDVMKPSGLPIKYALDHGYKGKLFPVNPNRETIQGLKAYPSIIDIPDDVEACVIVIPAAAVPQAVQQCADKGVKAVVIGVSGFAELSEEGKKRQDEIAEISRRSGLRICGPNTNGLLNVDEGISLGYSYAQEMVIPGRLGYVSQSGALLSATVPRFAHRGVGMSYFVGAGNQADLEVFDYVRYILEQPNTDAIAVYVEGFKNPSKFLDIADFALEKEKPIALLKIGRSELSARAARSHTGSLVGSDEVVDAICKQKGIARVGDFDELIAVSSVFLKCKSPKGDRVGVISSSGGAIGLIADRAIGSGLRFVDVSPETKEQASVALPWYGEFRSPFDIAAAGSRATQKIELARTAIDFILNDENVDILLAIITPMDRRGTQNYIQALVEAKTEKPVVLFSPMASLREEEAKIFTEGDIPLLTDSAECVHALSSLIRFGQVVRRYKESKKAPEPKIAVDVEQVEESLKLSGKTLTEYESKKLLSRYGIPVTEEAVAKSPAEAARIASRMGYPVVLKVDSPDILHKTDAGAIKLDIANESELIRAYHEVVANSKKYDPKADIRGVLVQEMTEVGREVIVGMSYDAQFGPTIAFGLGGVFVEVMRDISLRVAPITRHDAEEMVREIKGHKILEAFRGKPEADIDGIIDTLLKVSRLSIDLQGMISEIDINPLIVFDKGKGVKAVDALIILK